MFQNTEGEIQIGQSTGNIGHIKTQEFKTVHQFTFAYLVNSSSIWNFGLEDLGHNIQSTINLSNA